MPTTQPIGPAKAAKAVAPVAAAMVIAAIAAVRPASAATITLIATSVFPCVSSTAFAIPVRKFVIVSSTPVIAPLSTNACTTPSQAVFTCSMLEAKLCIAISYLLCVVPSLLLASPKYSSIKEPPSSLMPSIKVWKMLLCREPAKAFVTKAF